MKKKFFGFFAFLMFAVVFFGGCATLVRRSYKAFSPVETSAYPWQFFGKVHEANQTIQNDFETYRSLKAYGYNDLYKIFDGMNPLSDALINSITALDLHAQSIAGETSAHYNFNHKKNYVIQKGIGATQYKISYDKVYMFNNSSNRDLVVDSIIENILFKTDITIRVTPGTNKEENSISFDAYTVKAPEQAFMQDYANQVSSSLTAGDTKTEVNLTTTYSGVNNSNMTAVVSRVKTKAGQEIYRYEKTLRFVAGSYLEFEIKASKDGFYETPIKKQISLNVKPLSAVYLAYDLLQGSLTWNMDYNSNNGVVNYMGEVYFQGRNKYLMQEKVTIPASGTLGFENSFITQLVLDGELYYFKAVNTNAEFESIKQANVLKVGVYNNEPSAFVFSKESVAGLPKFQRYG